VPLERPQSIHAGQIAAGVNFNGLIIYQRPVDNGAIGLWTINGGLFPAMSFCSMAPRIMPRWQQQPGLSRRSTRSGVQDQGNSSINNTATSGGIVNVH
jgi:hypothetical protein